MLAWRPEHTYVIEQGETNTRKGGDRMSKVRPRHWCAPRPRGGGRARLRSLRLRRDDGSSCELGRLAYHGLGSTPEEIQPKAKDEGQTNLVIWAGYAHKSWADDFTKQTACKVITKDGATSDDMVDLMATGAYDGVSASGDATLRLIARGDVAPVNFDLIAELR